MSTREKRKASSAKPKSDTGKKVKIDETPEPKEHIYEPKAYNDLEIHVDQHVFYCHQMRLAELSQYFEHYFELNRGGESVRDKKHETVIWPPCTDGDEKPSSPFHKTITWQVMKSILNHVYHPMDWVKSKNATAHVAFGLECQVASYFQMPNSFVKEMWRKAKTALTNHLHTLRDKERTDFIWKMLEQSLDSGQEEFKAWAIDQVCTMDMQTWLKAPTFLTGDLWRTIHARESHLDEDGDEDNDDESSEEE